MNANICVFTSIFLLMIETPAQDVDDLCSTLMAGRNLFFSLTNKVSPASIPSVLLNFTKIFCEDSELTVPSITLEPDSWANKIIPEKMKYIINRYFIGLNQTFSLF